MQPFDLQDRSWSRSTNTKRRHDGRAVDPAWLRPGSGVLVWVVIDNPTAEEARILSDVFHFHELAIEDALERDPPSEDRVLRRLPLPDPARHRLPGAGSTASRRRTSISSSRRSSWSPFITARRDRSRKVDADLRAQQPGARRRHRGAAAPHVDAMVDNYRPEVEKLAGAARQAGDRGVREAEPEAGAADPRLQARRRLAAAGRAAAARRGRPAGPARVPADLRAAGVPLPRRPRPPRAAVGRGDVLPGSDLGHPRRAPVGGLEPVER